MKGAKAIRKMTTAAYQAGLPKLVRSIILLCCIASLVSYPLQQIANGLEESIELTSNSASFEPSISVTDNGTGGDNVYILYRSGSDINFQKSGDNGDTFGGVITVGDGITPKIVALPSDGGSGDNLFLSWGKAGNVLFTNSSDGGASFSPIATLTSSGTVSSSALAAVTNSTSITNVYVVWQEGSGEIYLKRSTDGGLSFGDAQKLNEASAAFSPQVAVSATDLSTNVYVVWQQIDGNIYFRASYDAGDSFESSKNLSGTGGAFNPQVAASPDGNAFVTWAAGLANIEIFFKAITDGGTNFDNPVKSISSDERSSLNPQISVSTAGNDIYLAWRDNYLGLYNPTSFETFYSSSSDGGSSFGCPINLSNTQFISSGNIASTSNNLGIAYSPSMSSSTTKDAAYVIWQENSQQSPPNGDLLLQKEIDDSSITPTITIDFMNNTRGSDNPEEPPTSSSIYWGASTIMLNGSLAGAAAGDAVNVDWGDSNIGEATVSQDGCSWYAIHQYGFESSNNLMSINASLGDVSTNIVSSTGSPSEVTILPHPTKFLLSEVPSVVSGSALKVKGQLVDDLNGEGIGDVSIKFVISYPDGSVIADDEGNPVQLLPSVTTFSNGSFVSEGTAPNIAADGWLVTAVFDGNNAYDFALSDSVTFDTTDLPPKIFNVEAGDFSLSLPINETEFTFPALINFHDVAESGTVAISECKTPPVPSTNIYPDPPILKMCLRITPHLSFGPNAFTIVNMTFGGKLGLLSPSYSESQIDVFQQRDLLAGDIADVTQDRSLASDSVIGNVTTFGKIFAEVALFPERPLNAQRQQLYLGHNEISYRDVLDQSPVNATIQLSGADAIGDTVQITINDMEANIDHNLRNTVSALVFSTSDNETGTNVTLNENAINSGIFEGSFVLTSDDSSPGFLHAGVGDELFAIYDGSHGRMNATIDGVLFSGMLDVSDYQVGSEASFAPIGGAVDVKFVGPVGLSFDSGKISITMSYANLFIGENKPDVLNLYHRDPDLAASQGRVDGWAIISPEGGLNKDAMTISGETTVPGPFSIGFEGGERGGSGGGLGRAGPGIVVDFVASIKRPSQTSGGGGGGGGGPAVDLTTYSSAYFAINPLSKIQVLATALFDSGGSGVTQAAVGQEVSISTSFKNYQQLPQQYAYIVTVTNGDGLTVKISSEEGTIESGQTLQLSQSWIPDSMGAYRIKIFMWDSISNSPIPLSDVTSRNITLAES